MELPSNLYARDDEHEALSSSPGSGRARAKLFGRDRLQAE